MEGEVKERGQVLSQQAHKGLQVDIIDQPVRENPESINNTETKMQKRMGHRSQSIECERCERQPPEALVDPQSGDVVLVVVELGMGSEQTLEHLRVGCWEDKNKTSMLITHRTDFQPTVLLAVWQESEQY